MRYLLNSAYLTLLIVALPWLLYQRLRYGKYREGWAEKLWGRVPHRQGNRPCLWLHAVSVGEVMLLEPLLSRWRQLHPDWDCVISTTTQTGYALARKKFAAVPPAVLHPSSLPPPPSTSVIYCPLDFTWAVRRAIGRIRPSLLVLTELELWPNLIAAAKQHGAPIAVVNGRLGEKSFRGYQRLQRWLQPVLGNLDLIAVQNQEYAQRFLALGASPHAVEITGSIKYDGARTNRQNQATLDLAKLAGLQPDDVVFLAGSTQDPEEELALNVFRRLSAEFPQLRLILVPRHPERFDEVAAHLDRSGILYRRRTSLDTAQSPPLPASAAVRVLLIDAVGELGHWWGTAQIAFVGGSLTRRGGQNMIEPAAYGAAVSFGPNTWNFRDIVSQLLAHQAAMVVQSEHELEQFVRRCLTDASFAAELGSRAQALVLQQQGAADRTIHLLAKLVAPASRRVAA